MRLVWWSTHSAKLGSPKYLGQHVKKDSGIFMEGQNLYINIYGCFQTLYVEKNGYMTDNGCSLASIGLGGWLWTSFLHGLLS